MSDTIDQQFIEYIVKALVGNPDAVKIERRIDEKGVLLELHVAPEDLGRVIGRNGATAKSIRVLLRALGVKNDARYNLKIVDTNGGGRREDREDSAPSTNPREDVTPADEGAPAEASSAVDETVEDVAVETPAEESTEEAAVEADEQADEEAEKKEDEDSSVSKHREDLKDLTDFDI